MDIRRATPHERLQIYRDVHPMWGHHLPLSEFLQKRLDSPRHQRPTWWLLHDGTRIAASLGCHPLTFYTRGARVAGFGFAAVYTHPDARRRGYARALCEHVTQDAKKRGAQVGLLFSDIAPAYYERMGFQCAPHSIWSVSSDRFAPASTPLQSFDPQQHISLLHDLYTHSALQHTTAIARDLQDWNYSLCAHPKHLFFLLPISSQASSAPISHTTHGVLRLSYDTQDVHIEELHLPIAAQPAQRDSLCTEAWSFAAEFARSKVIPLVTSWTPPPEHIQPLCDVQDRAEAITMLCDLTPRNDLDLQDVMICSSDHF